MRSSPASTRPPRNSSRTRPATRHGRWPRRSAPSSCELDVRRAWWTATSPSWPRRSAARSPGSADDLALQNIQARVRAPGGLAAGQPARGPAPRHQQPLEAAVGYATMDGDTCGGLSPDRRASTRPTCAGGCAGWRRTGPAGSAPMPALAAVNRLSRRPPSCDRRARDQTDEGDLMPYDLLDAIERAAIRDKLRRLEVFAVMRAAVSRARRRPAGRLGRALLPALVAATSGSGSATPRRSTSTTRTSTPRPGAASRSSPATSSGSWTSSGGTSPAWSPLGEREPMSYTYQYPRPR